MFVRLILIAVFAFTARIASADYIFQLRQDSGELGLGADGPGMFSVAEGGSSLMQIYLTQTAADSRLTANGLGIADITFNVEGGAGVTLTSFALGNGFVDDFFAPSRISGQSARLSVIESSGLTGVRPGAMFPASVHIGSVELFAAAGSRGLYTLGVGTTAGANFPLNDGLLSPLSANPITNSFAVTVVPEPGSEVLLLAIGIGALRQRRRN